MEISKLQSVWYEKLKTGQDASGYIILEDVPDGKWPRCCFCLRPRFVLLHLLQDTTESARQRHAPHVFHRTGADQ